MRHLNGAPIGSYVIHQTQRIYVKLCVFIGSFHQLRAV